MKTKKVEKVTTTLKDRIGHPFKEALYRNRDMISFYFQKLIL